MRKQIFASAACASVSLWAFSAAAMAQEVVQSTEGAASVSVADIIVNGSRILRDGYTAPTPVTVAKTENLVKATPANIPDALNTLPQFQNSFSPSRSSHNFANSASHGNVLDLRDVGGERTLILFDGVRLPPTTYADGRSQDRALSTGGRRA